MSLTNAGLHNFSSLLEPLEDNVKKCPDKEAFVYIKDSGIDFIPISYAGLFRRVNSISSKLRQFGLEGQCVFLAYPQGIDFVCALFACFHASVKAVPIVIPNNARRCEYVVPIAEVCGAHTLLTISDYVPRLQDFFVQNRKLADLQLIATDLIDVSENLNWINTASATLESIAFIQFTSGSTSAPKGVVLKHDNLLSNHQLIKTRFGLDSDTRFLSWMPHHHDFGLIGHIMQAVYQGSTCYLMAPSAFAHSPKLWLEAITRYRVNFTSSPNFGYQLCVDKISDEQIQHLDLRSWRHGLNGAERVRPSTMKAFYEKFASCGLGKSVQTPIYGLAEGTLIVSTCEKNHDSAYLLVDRESLSKESISLVEEGHPRAEAIANCGKTTSDQSIVIVNPSSRTKLLPYQVGEIWLSGPCVASEYYKLELESETKLRAKLDSSDAESWLRTGDLGFLDGEGDLYVTGRIKELIIIRGQNYYPQDIEVLVEKSHPALTAGCGAAFSVSHNSGEQLVIAYEVKRAFRKNYDLNEIADALCSAIWEKFGLELSAFVLLKPSGVMRTSSGKIQRSAYAVAYENDSFDYLDIWLPKSSARQDHTKTTSIEQTKIEEIEAALTLIWSETLNNDRISRDDKFFMVGGDSLSATTIAAEVRRRFGKELSMEAVLSHPTIRSMARYILEQRQCQTELVTIEHDSANRFERFPLNQIQQAYWLGRSRDIEFGAIGTHLYFEKRWVNFCPDRFSQALNLLIMRHDMLRMVVEDGGWQKVQREVESYVPKQYLLHTFDDTTRKSKLADIRSQLSHQVFDVTKWPLFDIRATRISEAEWIVHFSLDLILMDLGSLFIFFDELCKLYNDLQHELAPLKITFRDHVAFEKSLVDSEQYRKSNDYWLDRLAGFPESARLPINNFSITELQPKFSRLQYTLPSTKWHKIKTKAKEFNLTPSAVFIGAFAWLLKNWSSDDHFALNITLFNRPPLHPDIKKLLGDFTSILLLEVDFSQVASSFVDGLGRIQRQLWNDLDHRLYSGLEFQRQLRSKKGESLLYPIVVSSALGLEEEEQFRPGIEFLEQDVEYSVSQTSQVWLDVQVKESSKGLHFSWDSLDSVFPSEFIKNMFSGFVNFLIRLAEEDDAWFGRFVPGDSEAHVMLSQRVNETDIVFPREGEVLHGPLLRQMNVQGSKPAVITREYTLTFEELDKQSQVLARALVQAGARVNSLVAVYQQRGWRQIVSVLGVLRSGAAYLPISTSFPEERVNKLLDCGDVEIIVCEPELRDLLPSDIKAISLEELQNRPHETREVDLPKIMPTDLAYVIFTSGSTGDPKGVMMEHGACLNTIIDINQRCGVSDSDTAFALSALNFDLSVYDIFGVLGAGGTIIIPTDEETLDPKAWFKYLEQYRITLWNSVPALMQMLLESREPDSILPLRQVLLSGDWIPVDLPARIAQHAPDAKVLSLGGATEAAIWSIYFPVDWQALDASLGSIPYGKPLSNQKFYVLHNDLGLCPVWVEGDLYIGGVGLSRGYWKDNDKTGKSFITHPVSGERLYRTGDRGRLLPDGNIEFLGRLDQQLKIQGFRVEAGEVEAHLKSHPGVNDAVVIARTVNQAKQLVAYIVVKGGDTEDEDEFLADLRAHLERKLPPYMLPECYRIIDKIPLSANGKIDRAALPEPDYRGKARADSGLQNELEKRLASIWARVLKVPISDIDRFSNFFQFGGHSMLAVRLSMDIKRELNRDIAIGRLIRCNTIAKLAAYLSQNPDTQSVETGLPAVERELPAVVPDEAGRFSSFPLNEIQHAYWLGRSGEFTLGNIATHGYYEFQISPKTLEGFEKAWNFLVDRHDMLRVVVTSDATQCVLEPGRYYNVPVSDLSKASNAEIEAHQERTREQMSHQVFDTAQWPLFDIRISRYPGDMAILHVSLDALMLDMSSLLVLLNELNILINRPHIQLDDLQIRFRDYLLAEKELIHTTLYHNSKNYWLARLDDFPDAPALPLAKPPESIRTPRFQRHHFQISGDSWHFIKSRSAEINITPTVIFVTCFAEVLKYWCDSPHFTLNLTQFNRLPLHKQINSVVGDFTSLMLLEMDCRDPNTNFVRRLEQVQKQLWSDLDHRYFDGVEMQRALTLARGQHVQYPVVITSALGLNSLFDSGELGISAEETFELVYGVSQTPQVWLDIQISEQANGLRIDFDSVVDLFPDGMLLPLFEAVIDKLSGLAKDAKAWEDNNYFVSGYAHDALVQRVNNSKRTFTGGYSLLHDPVMDQISRRGNKPAIKTRDKSLSYAELGALSEKLAKRLYINGAKPDQLVAIVLEKGWEEVVSVLGVLRAGAAYLPIDASLPSGRIELLLREGCVKQIVTSKEFLDRVPSDYATTLIHDVVEQPLEEPVYLPRANETDLSYVIFTSGSTGKPKGVMIEHHAALNTVQDVNERFGVTDKDCVLGLSNLSFDLSVYDIFGVLGAGGTLVLPESHERRNPEVWSDLIRRENVTIWNSVPTLMQMFVEFNLATQRAFQIRLVLLSGDWIPLALPRQIADRMHDTKVVSLGGATEASIWSITYPIDCRCIEDRWVSIPYGQALANQQCYVMNRRLQLSPVGVPGNIYIAGKGLARGYWRDQEKTNSSFILHPESGQRLYRTGDRGRLLSDGNIEFLGRLDKQVKVNGYRIELGEIENCLGKHPLVKEAIVDYVSNNTPGELGAYVVLHKADLENEARKVDFKLSQPGVRELDGDVLQIPRDELLKPFEIRQQFDGRDVNDIYRLCKLAYRHRFENQVFPKALYPSGGTLYPVQLYLDIPHGYSSRLPGGLYYYHPLKHQLQRLADSTERDSYKCYLAADLNSVEPIYGEYSLQLCNLEAGYLAYLLCEHGLEFTAASEVTESENPSHLRSRLQLSDEGRVLVCLAPRASGVSTGRRFKISHIQRKSYRHYDGGALSISSLKNWLMPIAEVAENIRLDVDLQYFMHLHQNLSDHSDNLCAGVYRVNSRNSELELVSRHVPEPLFTGKNRLIEDRAQLSFFVVCKDKPTRFALQAAGYIGQLLSCSGIEWKIGVCAIGVSNERAVRQHCKLSEDQFVVHSILAGKVSDAQINTLDNTSPDDDWISSVRAWLSKRLPAYMVPDYFQQLDRMPMGSNGKVDRKALLALRRRDNDTESVRKTRNTTEKMLTEIWRELLGHENFEIHSHFFEVGGSSLLAIRLRRLLNEKMKVDISVTDIFSYSSIASLAEFICRHASDFGKEIADHKPSSNSDANQTSFREIAVIGLACRFPDAGTPEVFWQNLLSGRESIQEFSDDELLRAGVPPEVISDPDYVKTGFILENINQFDTDCFGFSAREAEIMDPQQRLLFECVNDALESSGYGGYRPDRVGLFVGVSDSKYLHENLRRAKALPGVGELDLLIATGRDYAATRIAHKFNFTGPAVSISTACSTSLVAVHEACENIRNGACSMALAGGASVMLLAPRGVLVEDGDIHSPDGRCRTFDAKARGTRWRMQKGMVTTSLPLSRVQRLIMTVPTRSASPLPECRGNRR